MLPQHLAGFESQGLRLKEPVAQYHLGDYRNFTYFILDWESRQAAIVDPQTDLTSALNDLRQNGLQLTSVFLTHSHFDHIAGVPALLNLNPKLPVFVHPRDIHRLPAEVQKSIHPLSDGDVLFVGNLSVKVIHTPGHSSGECCYFFEKDAQKYLFTGDTLFIRDCGRTDFPDGSNEEMFTSLQRLKALPADTIILPGHHYVKECASTLSKECQESAPLRCKSVQELAALP